MTRITTLICSAILASATASPVLAGGKTVAGSTTTVPPSVTVAAPKAPLVTIRLVLDQYSLTSTEVANLIALYRSQVALASGVSEDRINIVAAAQ